MLKLKPILPLTFVVQLLIGVGTVIGLGYLVPGITPESARFLVTGGPTLTLISLGLVLVPQMVGQAKAAGTFDYMRSLPVPRMAFLAAELTTWLLVTLPGLALAVIVGSRHYGFDLDISPLVLPAVLLVGLTATMVGYAIAHLAPNAELVAVITNFIIFCLFLFSPINYPAERLPTWLAQLHQFLPVKHAADAIRGTLTPIYGEDLGVTFLVLGVWCLIGFAITYVTITRRR
jgi:ABC-2 type transport system permease protein